MISATCCLDEDYQKRSWCWYQIITDKLKENVFKCESRRG